jgi:hypothetical protein
MIMRNVIQLTGEEHSGAMLACRLFDSIEGVMGLGKARWLSDDLPPNVDIEEVCASNCGDRCDFYDNIYDNSHLYSRSFSQYPRAHTLVDASLNLEHAIARRKLETGFCYLSLRFVQLPHEWLYHACEGERDPRILDQLIGRWVKSHLVEAPSVFTILYRDFVSRPVAWLEYCMSWLARLATPRREQWWVTDAHMRGVRPQPQGKQQIILDKSWRKDEEFVGLVRELYTCRKQELDKDLLGIGLFTVDMLLADLHRDTILSTALPAVQGHPHTFFKD